MRVLIRIGYRGLKILELGIVSVLRKLNLVSCERGIVCSKSNFDVIEIFCFLFEICYFLVSFKRVYG